MFASIADTALLKMPSLEYDRVLFSSHLRSYVPRGGGGSLKAYENVQSEGRWAGESRQSIRTL